MPLRVSPGHIKKACKRRFTSFFALGAETNPIF